MRGHGSFAASLTHRTYCLGSRRFWGQRNHSAALFHPFVLTPAQILQHGLAVSMERVDVILASLTALFYNWVNHWSLPSSLPAYRSSAHESPRKHTLHLFYREGRHWRDEFHVSRTSMPWYAQIATCSASRMAASGKADWATRSDANWSIASFASSASSWLRMLSRFAAASLSPAAASTTANRFEHATRLTLLTQSQKLFAIARIQSIRTIEQVPLIHSCLAIGGHCLR